MAKKNFDITICRIGYGFCTIPVEAKNLKEAEDIAMDMAGDFEYPEKSSDYEIEGAEKRYQKILDVSTANVSESTATLLDNGVKIPVRYVKHEYGWMFFLSSLPFMNVEQFKQVPELQGIIEHAKEMGCMYVNFDRDADELDGFETFIW